MSQTTNIEGLQTILETVNNLPAAIEVDATLTQEGMAADAKAVGDALANIDVGVPVESVNGKTGAVVLTASDVGSIAQTEMEEHIDSQTELFEQIADALEAHVNELPSSYVRLSQVESNGSAWFNAHYKPGSNTRVVLDFKLTSTATHIFGARTDFNDKAFCVCWLTGMPFVVQIGNNTYSIGSFDETARHTIDMTATEFKLDGVSKATYNVGTFQCLEDMWLFSCPNGSDTENSSGFIYDCKIYDNNILIRHYVPARNASLVVGFYDLVNRTFDGSMTATPFTGV